MIKMMMIKMMMRMMIHTHQMKIKAHTTSYSHSNSCEGHERMLTYDEQRKRGREGEKERERWRCNERLPKNHIWMMFVMIDSKLRDDDEDYHTKRSQLMPIVGADAKSIKKKIWCKTQQERRRGIKAEQRLIRSFKRWSSLSPSYFSFSLQILIRKSNRKKDKTKSSQLLLGYW